MPNAINITVKVEKIVTSKEEDVQRLANELLKMIENTKRLQGSLRA
ncbi:hypothetical protein QT236_12560 [Geobacillus stearothermophilus]|nr:hypothetical protein QT236_12560 [Geobacillus stearothermophilus]